MSIDEMADEFKELPVGDTSRGIAAAKNQYEKLAGKLNKNQSIETSSKVQEPTVPEVSTIMEAWQEGQRPAMDDKDDLEL